MIRFPVFFATLPGQVPSGNVVPVQILDASTQGESIPEGHGGVRHDAFGETGRIMGTV